MPLARLENFLKNLDGNTLYVDPNEIDSTDSIENQGNSRLRPFKTIQRALLEAARFSYIGGSNNDKFDQTTILISPGTHYIDNRPGYYVDSAEDIRDVNNSLKSIGEFNILSNFDITDPSNELYIYNSVDGGVIIPRGTSIVATDLRKTKIRPLFVPDPNSESMKSSAIFKLTGSCYFYGFTIYDGDPLGKVYNTNSSTSTVSPNFSHHKLTAFEYADGVNKVKGTSKTDLDMYYYKLAEAYGNQSGRGVIDGYSNFQPSVDEYRIVGELGSGSIGISSVRSGDGTTATNLITVTTESEHGLSPLTPILISGVGAAEQGVPTTTEYNVSSVVAQVISPTVFTYTLVNAPTGAILPNPSGSFVKVISDTVSSSSPYVFNCTLKSVYGLNGLHADGSKATGFRSIVTAQFTGISLQKDDRAFVKYSDESGTYLDQTNYPEGTEFLHQNIDSIYKPDWSSFHIKASNDAFIQCVSIFAIGYANQFVSNDGGDQSITNSNSNFGQRSLYSAGFKKNAFLKDDFGFITHIIPPKDFSSQEENIDLYQIDETLPNSTSKVYLKGYDDFLNPPPSKNRNYSIGGKQSDKIYYAGDTGEYSADIPSTYKISKNITAIDIGENNTLTLENVTGISTGLPTKVIAKNSILPDGIEHDQTYFVGSISVNDIKLYKNIVDCNLSNNPVNITTDVGLESGNLSIVTRLADLSSGDVGSPVQWDSTENNWYIAIDALSSFVDNISANRTLYLKRVIDTRSNEDKIYRVRYVVPKDSLNAAVPAEGFVIQKSSRPLNSSYAKSSDSSLAPATDVLSSVRNKNVIIDASYTSSVATIVTKNSHNLKVGNKVSIYNLKSSNEPNPVGLGTGTGYNGEFSVLSVVDDLTFTYSTFDAVGISTRNPGTITTGDSAVASWYSNVTSSYKAPPYTIYSENRETLPYFTCDEVANGHQLYGVKEIQKYVYGSSDGVYHITLDCFKNTPIRSPFNTSEFKFGQNLDSVYPLTDYDNLIIDADFATTSASRKTIGKVDINDPYLSSSKEILIQQLKDFNLGNQITGFTKSGSSVTITTSSNHGIGGIRNATIDSSGSGYTDGNYYDIPLLGGSGVNATINVTVSGGSPSSVEIANPGSGYVSGETLTVAGIPGSTNTTTVTITLLNFDSGNSDLIQIFGATNSGNNGSFVISSVTENTITFENASGVTEATTNAVVVLSGVGHPISTSSYDSVNNITTLTTPRPHPFSIGNKVIFNTNLTSNFTVISVSNSTTFSVEGSISSPGEAYLIGLIPTLKDTNFINENLTTRAFVPYSGYKSVILTSLSKSSGQMNVLDVQGLKKGDFVQIENEIVLVTRISGGSVSVKRGLFGTQSVDHPSDSAIRTITINPVELRRPSILRASGHTFEYVGFGPGNYSTSMPSNQTKVLTDDEVSISQSLTTRAGLVFYSGMNSDGEFFIGKQKWNSSTGNQIDVVGGNGGGSSSSFTDDFTVNRITVNKEINAATATQTVKSLTVNGESTFKSGITVTGITTSTTFVGNGVIPVGGIIMWSGTVSDIGTGELTNWALCNGSNGTPDLRNRFVVGAHSGSGNGTSATAGPGFNASTGALNSNYTPGNTGGEVAIQLTEAELASHTHRFSQTNEGVNSGGASVMDGLAVGTAFSPETVGEDDYHENRPPYYALAFIMRVS